MHAKYEVSICFSSKVIAKDKAFCAKNMQTKGKILDSQWIK